MQRSARIAEKKQNQPLMMLHVTGATFPCDAGIQWRLFRQLTLQIYGDSLEVRENENKPSRRVSPLGLFPLRRCEGALSASLGDNQEQGT